MVFFLLFSLLPLMIASALIGMSPALICGLALFVGAYLGNWRGFGFVGLAGLLVSPWAGFFSSEPAKATLFLFIAIISSVIAVFFKLGKGLWKEQVFNRLDQIGMGFFLADHQVQVMEKEAFLQEREEDVLCKRLFDLLKKEGKKSESLEREIALLEEIISKLSHDKPLIIRRKKSKEEKGQTLFPLEF